MSPLRTTFKERKIFFSNESITIIIYRKQLSNYYQVDSKYLGTHLIGMLYNTHGTLIRILYITTIEYKC